MKQRYYGQHARTLQRELLEAIPKEDLKRLHEKNALRHGLLALRQFLLLVLCTYGAIRLTNIWLWLPVSILLGLTIFNFTVLLHEVVHHGVFNEPNPKVEARLAWLYAIPSGISATQFSRWHLDHHAELGSMDDPKRNHLSPKKNVPWLKLLYATPCLFFIYFRAAAAETAGYDKPTQRIIARERRISIAVHLTYAISIGYLLGATALWKAYLIPVFFIFPIAFALNRLGQHYAIDPADPAKWSTLMPSHPVWNQVYLYSNLHLEHHYFPGVPCYNLPKLQQCLKPFYQSRNMEPMGYGKLIYGWLIENRKAHSLWK